MDEHTFKTTRESRGIEKRGVLFGMLIRYDFTKWQITFAGHSGLLLHLFVCTIKKKKKNPQKQEIRNKTSYAGNSK